MKKLTTITVSLLLAAIGAHAEVFKVSSPDGRMLVNISTDGGKLTYEVIYDGKKMIEPSTLGLNTDMGDYTHNLTLKNHTEGKVDEKYTMSRTDVNDVHLPEGI